MNQVVDFRLMSSSFNSTNSQVFAINPLKAPLCKSYYHPRNPIAHKQKRCSALLSSSVSKLVDQTEHSLVQEDNNYDGGKFAAFPHVQYLRNFPREELFGKVVMVRFDTLILLQGMKEHQSLPANAFFTIKYLYDSSAKVILAGSWNESLNPKFRAGGSLSTKSVADFLSSMLELEVVPVKHVSGSMDDSKKLGILLIENLFWYKGERANCSKFAKELASGIDIIVNDAFSESHKILASTVGATRFCYACIAGFHFEECLYKLQDIIETTERPYIAIIGGGKLADKAAALQFLVSTCDGLVFVGSMAFQIMYALGVPVPMKLVETGALEDAARIVESAKSRNIPLVLPQDVWCITDHVSEEMQIASVHSIPESWQPVDIGPRSLEEMTYFLSQCKKITWLGPLRFSSTKQDKGGGTVKLAEGLGSLSSCNVTFVGKMEFEESLWKSKSFSHDNFLRSAAVVWEILKGGKLPGLLALDRAYPFLVDWSSVYDDPIRPLVVDIGSGNGLFLFEMGRRKKDMNFLGLEMNAKLVDCCLDDVHQLGIHNVHFIATNATSTFRSIVSSYPGELMLVSIQCPNPDFNKPQSRWKMLQRSLVEAIADKLVFGGKVFLQSDIEDVAMRMKEEFMIYGKGKLAVMENSGDMETKELGWLKENPFGVPSDWERHVLARDDPMYRLLLSKVESRD